jgi:hypothetical protein
MPLDDTACIPPLVFVFFYYLSAFSIGDWSRRRNEKISLLESNVH